MKTYSHLNNQVLLRTLASLITRDCTDTVELIACIGEVDARRLYRQAGYPSMYKYCVHEFHMCEQAAYKRIRAARMARRFPAIYAALADGRLHLSAVVMLSHYLTERTAAELLKAAEHKTKSEIERLLAERFPQPDLPTWIEPIEPLLSVEPVATGRAATFSSAPPASRPVDATPVQLSPGTVAAPAERPRVAPLSPQRYALQGTMRQSMHEKLRYAQELLGHENPAMDEFEVLERGLDELILKLEKRKFAATDKPRARRTGPNPDSRHVPADVRRAVRARDGRQCTFVGENGRRCSERSRLEFDHVLEVARGGRSTLSNLRLRCRTHNQYTAEQTYGAGFMERRREETRRAAAEAREKAAAKNQAAQPGGAPVMS